MKNDSGIKGDFPDVADTDEEGSESHVSSHLAWRKVLTAQILHSSTNMSYVIPPIIFLLKE